VIRERMEAESGRPSVAVTVAWVRERGETVWMISRECEENRERC